LVYFAVVTLISFTGVTRGCAGAKSENTCKKYNHQPVPELKTDDFTGEICYCTGDLCNAAPQTSIGHLMVSLIGVVSLLALTTARILSE